MARATLCGSPPHRVPRSRLAAPASPRCWWPGVLIAPGVAHAEHVWDRRLRVERQLVDQHRQRLLRRPAVLLHLARLRRRQYASYAHQASKAEQIDTAQEVLKVQDPAFGPCSVRAA